MKLITRDTDYAIRALSFIGKCRKEIVSVKELVTALKIPKPFLRKILQALNKAKLLKSYKGKAGGFKMAASPDKISLLDLMNLFQGAPFEFCEHTFKDKPCPNRRKCRLKNELDIIEKDVIVRLKRVTIGSLL